MRLVLGAIFFAFFEARFVFVSGLFPHSHPLTPLPPRRAEEGSLDLNYWNSYRAACFWFLLVMDCFGWDCSVKRVGSLYASLRGALPRSDPAHAISMSLCSG